MEKLKRCRKCEKILATWNKSGLCSNCYDDVRERWKPERKKRKKKYDKERYLKIKNSSCSIL